MDKNINEAKRQYLERYASTIVTNTYLRVALFAVSVALIGVLLLTYGVFRWARDQKPLVVRLDEVGRAVPISYPDYSYKPQAPELRYFLAQFVQCHFTRILGTVEEKYGNSLYFLDAKLSQVVIEEERKSHAIETFIREGHEEVDAQIKNIVLQDIRSRPMKAAVDFEKVFYQRGERRELRRESYSGYFEFVAQAEIPNSFVLVNPLGLIITYFRIDAAFK